MIAIITDSEIQQKVLEELNWEPRVDAAGIGVSVEDGVVTLTGSVSTYLQRWAAEKAAKRVDGVHGLVNKIRVKLSEGDQRTDEDIAEAALNALSWHLLVPAKSIKVTVERGWVKLEGQVRWRFQKDAAERAVEGVRGVIGVTNLITVGPKLESAEIAQQIENAIRRSAALAMCHIVIDVHDGAVTLRGVVHSMAERDEAERIAWNAPGVDRVDNRLTVER